LQQASLGHAGGVTNWLESNGLARQPRLADRLQVESGWERAVETVLGRHLQAVCVDALGGLADKLAALGKGTLTLLEARTVNGATYLNGTPLSSFVQGNETVSLLAGIYGAADLNEAMGLRDRLAAHESVVTKDGLWLGPNWLRVIREDDAESGVLARKQELARVVEELALIEEQLADRQTELDNGREGLRALELQREDAQKGLSQLTRRRGDVQAQLGAKQVRLEQFNARSSRIEKEMEDVQAQHGLDQEQLAESRMVLQEALETMGRDSDRRDELLRERDAARAGLDNDVGKLRRVGQPPQRAHGELKLLPLGNGLAANLAGGNLNVLALDGPHHVHRRQIARRHLGWVEPNSHAVIALSKKRHVADAGEAEQLVLDLNGGVVGQQQVVAEVVSLGVLRRHQVDDHHDVGRLLFDRHALLLDDLRDDRHGQAGDASAGHAQE